MFLELSDAMYKGDRPLVHQTSTYLEPDYSIRLTTIPSVVVARARQPNKELRTGVETSQQNEA